MRVDVTILPLLPGDMVGSVDITEFPILTVDTVDVVTIVVEVVAVTKAKNIIIIYI